MSFVSQSVSQVIPLFSPLLLLYFSFFSVIDRIHITSCHSMPRQCHMYKLRKANNSVIPTLACSRVSVSGNDRKNGRAGDELGTSTARRPPAFSIVLTDREPGIGY